MGKPSQTSRGAGSSTGITPSSTTSCWRSGGDDAVLRRLRAGDRHSGKYKGTAILQDEQNDGLAMLSALDDDAAEEGDPRAFEDRQQQSHRSVQGQRRAGLRRSSRADAVYAAQRKQLLDLIALYIGNMDDGHARVKMDEVRQHLDQTRGSPGSAAPKPDERLLLPDSQSR